MSTTRCLAAGLVVSVWAASPGYGGRLQAEAAPAAAAPGAVALAEDGDAEGGSARLEALEARLAERPDDLDLLKKYQTEAVSQLTDLNFQARRDGSLGEPVRVLARRVRRVLDALRPTDAGAKKAVAEMADTVDFYRRQTDAREHTFEQLRRRLHADPADAEAMLVYEIKVQAEHDPFNEPEETRAQLATDKAFLAALKAKASNAKVRETVEALLAGTVPRLEKVIAESLAVRKALLGRDAPPLDGVDAWVNGGPLAAADLRGKVVLLEFWGVWCGPCIRLFPELSQWHEKYAGRGLRVIGVAGYENYKWDDAAGGPVEPEGGATRAQELHMLEKFVDKHKLPYPTAVQDARKVSEAYHVDGVPRTVLIDRRGTIRLIHSGTGQTRQVRDMISKLLAEDAGPAEIPPPRR